jgi:hypothetical protein
MDYNLKIVGAVVIEGMDKAGFRSDIGLVGGEIVSIVRDLLRREMIDSRRGVIQGI